MSPMAASLAAPLALVVLAAVAGTTMRSDVTKPLHRVGGLPLIGWALAAAAPLAPARTVVVVGPGAAEEAVGAAARGFAPEAKVAVQAAQRGTGDAVAAALPAPAVFAGRASERRRPKPGAQVD